MILRRFKAFMIDVIIAIIPILLVSLKYPYSLKSLLYMMIFLYLVHTSIFILSTGSHTIGEGIIGIRAHSTSQDEKITKKIFLKNLVVVFFLLVSVVNLPELLGSTISIILLIVLVIPDHKDQKTGSLRSILDVIFNIFYIDFCPEVKRNN